jgi:GntR family transcriptional regulator
VLAFRIDVDDPRPVFRQIVDEVQRSIAVGVLKAGDPLPAVRQLAKQLKVNANTVQHAYQALEGEGSVYVKRGIGTFVASVPREKQRQPIVARQIADAYRHGLLASDLIAALEELAPRREK